MNDDIKFFLQIVGWIIFAVLLVSLIVGGVLVNLDRISCNKTATAIGYKSEYSVWTGCVVENPDGKKMLLEQLREFGNK